MVGASLLAPTYIDLTLFVVKNGRASLYSARNLYGETFLWIPLNGNSYNKNFNSSPINISHKF